MHEYIFRGMRSVKNKHNRCLAAVLTLCLLLGLYPLTPSAQAEETTATVAGSTTRENAQSVPVGVPVTSTLSAGRNYYAIPDVKAGQQIGAELDKRYNGVYTSFCKPNGEEMFRNVTDVNGTHFLAINANTPTTVTFTVTLYDNDVHEPNGTLETATPIEPGVPVDAVLLSNDVDYFAFTTAKPYQYVVVDAQYTGALDGASLYDAAGAELAGGVGQWPRRIFCAGEAGTHYLKFFSYGNRASYSFTVTLYDNDANEPNDTKETAAALHDGESTEFTLAAGDVDYFKVTTTKPGQDIALTVSGYNYANRGEKFSLYLDPTGSLWGNGTACAAYAEIKANGTLYLHAAAAGEHDIALNRLNRVSSSDPDPLCLTRTLSVEILDGDANERNDTRETATPLIVGTDAAFMVGGFGDEDWFSFEAVPGAAGKTLYTLSFLDLNTDYSDEFFYEVYAPDGTPVVERTRVTIRHVNTIGCDQQGQYLVRVYTTAAKGTNYFTPVNGNYGRTMDYKRSTLRICVSEGGDDPYESNDTWLTAANVPVGKLQHVLATTADADWFCFTVPENDMTLHLTSTKWTNAALYRAENLMEQGDSAEALFNSGTDCYYKLTDAGVYYLKLTAGSSYVSPEIRTTNIKLLPVTDEENNDTWKKATPLYEGVLRSFEISAGNDVDWFKLVVPKGSSQLQFEARGSKFEIYRDQDFKNAGDSAAPVASWSSYSTGVNPHTEKLTSGTYYLKATAGGRMENCSIVYNILPTNTNGTLETAKTLKVGEWAEYYGYDMHYFSIGVRKAGEVVRISHDAVGGISANNNTTYRVKLLNASGEEVGSSYNYSANRTIEIPEDGGYYLGAKAYWTLDDNGEPKANRLRYDIGSSDGEDPFVDCEDDITMVEGESVFLDLRCNPENAKTCSSNYSYATYDVSTPDCVSYDDSTGYLTAKNAGKGVLKVSLKGEGNTSDEREITISVVARSGLTAERLDVSVAPKTLEVGKSFCLETFCTLTDGTVLTNSPTAVTWTSSDPKVLYVAPGGRATAVGSGTATITARVGDTSSTSDPITVTAPETPQETVSSIKLSEYSLKLYVGEPGKQLTASVLPAGSAASVKWTSSNPAVAKVSEKGFVTPVGPGMSIISAEAGGRRVSATAAVLAQRVRVSGVSFEKTSYELPLGGQRLVLEAEVTPGNATDKTLIWTSSNEGVATVSRTGIVTALSVGETTIRATSVDGGYFAEVTVTVTAKAQLGDVNGDGYIDAGDAMLCMRYSVGLAELTDAQKAAADVNRDGFIDAGDAILILRYDAKLIDRLN